MVFWKDDNMRIRGRFAKILAVLLALVMALPMGVSLGEDYAYYEEEYAEGFEPELTLEPTLEPTPEPTAVPTEEPVEAPEPSVPAEDPAPNDADVPQVQPEPTMGAGDGLVDQLPENGFVADDVVIETPQDAPVIEYSILLEENELTVDEGEAVAIEAWVAPEARLVFESLNPDIATVDEFGIVTGLRGGEATIVVRVADDMSGVFAEVLVTVIPRVQQLVAYPATVCLDVGESTELNLTALPAGAEMPELKWESDSADVVSVQDGKLVANGEGTALVTVTSLEDVSVSYTIPVTVEGAALYALSDDDSDAQDHGTIVIGVKQKYALDVNYDGGEALSFKASNANITVSSSGVVTGVSAGTATVTVSASDSFTDSYNIVVVKAPTKLTLTATSMTIGYGEEKSLGLASMTPAAYNEDGELVFLSDLTYTSKDDSIASYTYDGDYEGTVTGRGVGTVNVGIMAYNGVYAACKVTVKEAPTRIDRLEPSALTISQGETKTVKAVLSDGAGGTVYWEALDDDGGYLESVENGVITVNEDADIPEDGITVTLRARTYNYEDSDNKSALERTCEVTVLPAPTQLTLNGNAADATTLGVGESIVLKPELDKGQTAFKFATSNSKIVTVSSAGKITGKKEGTATITVTSSVKAHNTLKATCKVTVKKAPSKVSVSPTSKMLGVGDSLKLTTAITKNTASKLYFSSSDEKTVRVDDEGNIEALKQGFATITVKTFNNKKATCKVTVVDAPDWIELNTDNLQLSQGMSGTISLTVASGAATSPRFIYDSEVLDYLTITNAGVVTAKKGTDLGSDGKVGFEIKVRAHNYDDVDDPSIKKELEKTCKITVLPAPTKVNLNYSGTVTLGVGEKLTMVPTLEPEGAQSTYTFVSKNTKLATISKDGVLTAKKKGTVTVGVKTYNGLSAFFKVKIVKAPSAIKVSPTSKTLGEGDTVTLTPTVTKGSHTTVTYTSSDKDVAEVIETGEFGEYAVIKAKNPGATAVITAKTHNGKTARCTISVEEAPKFITLDQKELKISVGMSSTLKATPSTDSATTFSWSSEPTSIATVANGKVTGKDEGTATITVRSHNWEDNPEQLEKTCTVTVVAPPNEVTLEEGTSSKMGVKQTLQLTPILWDSDGNQMDKSLATYTYKSSNTKIATVSGTGVITAKKTGSATITVTTHNKKTVKCKVTVVKAPSSIKINPTYKTVGVGEIVELVSTVTSGSWTQVSYTSSDETVAKVIEVYDSTKKCKVEALKEGSTVITAKTHNGKTAKFTMNVGAKPTAISLDQSAMILSLGQSATLNAELSGNSAGTITWKSSDASIATVNSAGKVTAGKKTTGTVTITAETYNYAKEGKAELIASCKVTVLAAPTSVYLDGKNTGSLTLGVGESYTLTPSVNSGSTTSFTFLSAKSSIATMVSPGVVTGKAVGTTKVGVKTHNNLTAVYNVTVKKAPASISLSATTKIVTVNDGEFKLIATLSSGSASHLTCKSTNENVAEVEIENGFVYVTPVGQGTADITVSTYNGHTAKCTVIVTD